MLFGLNPSNVAKTLPFGETRRPPPRPAWPPARPCDPSITGASGELMSCSTTSPNGSDHHQRPVRTVPHPDHLDAERQRHLRVVLLVEVRQRVDAEHPCGRCPHHHASRPGREMDRAGVRVHLPQDLPRRDVENAELPLLREVQDGVPAAGTDRDRAGLARQGHHPRAGRVERRCVDRRQRRGHGVEVEPVRFLRLRDRSTSAGHSTTRKTTALGDVRLGPSAAAGGGVGGGFGGVHVGEEVVARHTQPAQRDHQRGQTHQNHHHHRTATATTPTLLVVQRKRLLARPGRCSRACRTTDRDEQFVGTLAGSGHGQAAELRGQFRVAAGALNAHRMTCFRHRKHILALRTTQILWHGGHRVWETKLGM